MPAGDFSRTVPACPGSLAGRRGRRGKSEERRAQHAAEPLWIDSVQDVGRAREDLEPDDVGGGVAALPLAATSCHRHRAAASRPPRRDRGRQCAGRSRVPMSASCRGSCLPRRARCCGRRRQAARSARRRRWRPAPVRWCTGAADCARRVRVEPESGPQVRVDRRLEAGGGCPVARDPIHRTGRSCPAAGSARHRCRPSLRPACTRRCRTDASAGRSTERRVSSD